MIDTCGQLLNQLLSNPETLRVEIQRVHKIGKPEIKEVQVVVWGIKPGDSYAVVAKTLEGALKGVVGGE